MSLQLNFKVPGQEPQIVMLDQQRMILGTLLSNQVVVRAPGVDPIHAMIEQDQDGICSITDLGSIGGVLLNGQSITVEAKIAAGDRILLGSVDITVEPAVEIAAHAAGEAIPLPIPRPPSQRDEETAPRFASPLEDIPDVPESEAVAANEAAEAAPRVNKTVRSPDQTPSGDDDRRSPKKDLLFSPRKARPSGDVLEVVAYWGDTILEVDLFHPRLKGFEKVTIGDPTKCHFIAAGDENISRHTLATVTENGYSLRLLPEMETRLRKNGQVDKKSGAGSVNMSRRDIAHIKYGSVSYFFLFIRPPAIDLPRRRSKDPIFMMLSLAALLFYLAVIPALWLSNPVDPEKDKDDIWSLVQVPKKEEKPQVPPKEKITVAEVKTPPEEVKPPPPKPKPVTPAKAEEKEKPKQKIPVEKPKEVPQEKPQTAEAKKESPSPVAKVAAGDPAKSKTGTAGADSQKPDFKKPGPKTNVVSPLTGGAKGSGMNQAGGERKGVKPVSQMGVEGPKNDKPSGVNLSKLGLGVGKILNQTSDAAIQTKFKNSAGGAGGGSGSGSRTVGLGGIGGTKSLGLAGSGSSVNNFGSGSGGFGSGEGGSGGLSGAGIGDMGKGGRGRADVTVPEGGPVVDGGLTRQEIMAVIRTNLNQIRHCYEQLLQRSPKVSGRLKVKFAIGADGRVTSTSIADGDISDSIMRGCVTGKVQRWAFPKPRGASSVNVQYPFVFTPL
jgi:outer membrane biosynthesis protein TonB